MKGHLGRRFAAVELGIDAGFGIAVVGRDRLREVILEVIGEGEPSGTARHRGEARANRRAETGERQGTDLLRGRGAGDGDRSAESREEIPGPLVVDEEQKEVAVLETLRIPCEVHARARSL